MERVGRDRLTITATGCLRGSACVREAGRFKATEEIVNDPSQNQEVIQGAIDAAPSAHLPQIVTKMVLEVTVSSSMLLEGYIISTPTTTTTRVEPYRLTSNQCNVMIAW